MKRDWLLGVMFVVLLPAVLVLFVYELAMHWKRKRDADRAWQAKLDRGGSLK